MLEPISCSKLIFELTSKRITTSSQRYLARRPTRHFSASTRCFASPQPSDRIQSRSQPPPDAEYVPSVKQISDYAAKVGHMGASGAIRSAAEPYAAYGSTEKLYGECARQLDYRIPNALKKPKEPAPKNAAGEDIGEGTGVWFAPKSQGGLELPVTFSSWAQVMYLHLYVLTVRLRRFPAEHVRIWEQHLMDHFYYAAEDKMEKWHGMAARGIRNKNLKDLWLQWRGALVSYDEGLIKGDTMLASAVWRAIFKADVNASIEDVALVTAYLRQELQRADVAPDTQLTSGQFKFGSITTLHQLLQSKSDLLAKSFSLEELAQLESVQAELRKAQK